ncbi:MAG TPA: DUF222 domain-containing protein [Jatrophihabitantaceae bacterium]|jgi:hypothetical protein
MFEGEESAAAPVAATLAQLSTALDTLAALDLTRLSRDELLELLRDFETHRRRLPVIDHALIAELNQRGTAGEMGARDTHTLLRDVLRVTPSEAKRRVAVAGDLGPGRSLSGQPRPPLLPMVAAAQAEGSVSPEHAQVIATVISELPKDVEFEHGAAVESRLVVEAQRFDPSVLATLARRVVALLNPDGVLADDVEHDRRRHATLSGNRDGSGELRAHLTPAALAQWQAVLDPLAAPRPSDADGLDVRSPGQRMHDALADAAHKLLASGDLPPSGGVPATVLLTLTLDQLETRTGHVTTAHGGTMSVHEALKEAGEAHVIPVVLDSKGILAYGQARRTATASQRLALAARDGGCCFPGCDAPPGWTQVHHILNWALGGGTDLINLCLLCGFHHREHEKRGWHVLIKHGQPWWIPPAHIDPSRTPIRNAMHDAAVYAGMN